MTKTDIVATNATDLREVPSKSRLASVDALRGFDMFWIIGGEGFAAAILQFFSDPIREPLKAQLGHAAWEGFRFYDLIFPLFVFLVGVSTALSLAKSVDAGGKQAAYWRLLRRAVMLYLFGLFYYGGLGSPHGLRLLGVLQRIALCYFFTALAVMHLRVRGLVALLVSLLAGYWALLCFVPLPGASAISFAPGDNWPNYLDARLLPGWKWDNLPWDPEGLLSTLPAIGTCLIGVLAAKLLRRRDTADRLKVCCLIGGGIAAVLAGYAWGLQFPIIKKLWTSSFVLVAGGYSCILMGVFYLLLDVWNWRRWATPFLWIGANAITLYMAENIVNFHGLAARLVGGVHAGHGVAPGPRGEFLLSGLALAMILLLARFLYRRGIFLRL